MRIVAYRTSNKDGKVLLEESGGDFRISDDPVRLFEFLLEDYSPCIKICWDLDSTVSLILKLLGESVCRKLRETKRAFYAGFSLFYVPEKVFIVNHPAAKMSLYGIEQYYPDLSEETNVELIQGYGVNLLKELAKMGMKPTKLTSPIAIYDECVMSKLDLPRLKDIPVKAAEFAYRCAARLDIESHQIGYWDKIYDYDLSSAFPSVAKELIDFRECKWVEDSKYHAEAFYGYTKVEVTIYDWVTVSPILRETEDGLISPVGTWEEYLTKAELDFITKWKIGEWKILEGWWAITSRKALKKPLKIPMETLLKYKQGTELQKLLAKRMSTGIYGRMGEDWGEEFGPNFNSVWFAEVSTQVRLQVGEFLYAHGIGPGDNEGYSHLCHIGVDGVMLTEPLTNLENGWRLAYEGEALIISSGLVYTMLTKPKGLKLGEVLEMVKEHPRQPYYEKKIKRRLTLGDSLAQHRLNDIGTEFDFSVSINLLNQEHDRIFPKVPQTGVQLLSKHYKSKPRRV